MTSPPDGLLPAGGFRGAIQSLSAISEFVFPAASRSTISDSRCVSREASRRLSRSSPSTRSWTTRYAVHHFLGRARQ